MYIVKYKYVEQMPIVRKSRDEFIKSILEKYDQFIHKKLELHVSPFYETSRGIYWQPVLDFDKPVGISEAKAFIETELVYNKVRLQDWFVEITSSGVHVCSHLAIGPIESIENLRNLLKRQYAHKYKHLDLNTSVRDLPVRRTLSLSSNGEHLVLPIRITTFLRSSYEEIIEEIESKTLTKEMFRKLLLTYVLPTKFTSRGIVSV